MLLFEPFSQQPQHKAEDGLKERHELDEEAWAAARCSLFRLLPAPLTAAQQVLAKSECGDRRYGSGNDDFADHARIDDAVDLVIDLLPGKTDFLLQLRFAHAQILQIPNILGQCHVRVGFVYW